MLAHPHRVDERRQEGFVLGHNVVSERLQGRAPALLGVQGVPAKLLEEQVYFHLR